jgi:DNA invertase Pin-like site-specific DNA recombinase
VTRKRQVPAAGTVLRGRLPPRLLVLSAFPSRTPSTIIVSSTTVWRRRLARHLDGMRWRRSRDCPTSSSSSAASARTTSSPRCRSWPRARRWAGTRRATVSPSRGARSARSRSTARPSVIPAIARPSRARSTTTGSAASTRAWNQPERLLYWVLLAEEKLERIRRTPLPTDELPSGAKLTDRIVNSRGSPAEVAARFARFGVTMSHVRRERTIQRKDPETGKPWLWPPRSSCAGCPRRRERAKEYAREVALEMWDGGKGESQRRISEATGIPRATLQRMLGRVRVIGYVRVSTEEQAISGLGLEAQRTALREAWRHREGRLVTVLSDEGYSGKDLDRPGLKDALADRRRQGRRARRRQARPPHAQQLGPRRPDRVVPPRRRRPDRARLRRPRHLEGVGPDDRHGADRGRAVGARLDR